MFWKNRCSRFKRSARDDSQWTAALLSATSELYLRTVLYVTLSLGTYYYHLNLKTVAFLHESKCRHKTTETVLFKYSMPVTQKIIPKWKTSLVLGGLCLQYAWPKTQVKEFLHIFKLVSIHSCLLKSHSAAASALCWLFRSILLSCSLPTGTTILHIKGLMDIKPMFQNNHFFSSKGKYF